MIRATSAWEAPVIMSSSPQTKSFLYETRKKLRESREHPNSNDVEVKVYESPKKTSSVESKTPQLHDTSSYIQLICQDLHEIFIPLEIASQSGLIKKMIASNSFKESRENKINLPSFNSPIIERVFRYCSDDYIANEGKKFLSVKRSLFGHAFDSVDIVLTSSNSNPLRSSYGTSQSIKEYVSSSPSTSPVKSKGFDSTQPNQKRVVTLFEIPTEDLLEVMMAAHFLDIPSLLELTCKQIAKYIDAVESLSGIPDEVVHLIYSYIPPEQLALVEMSELHKTTHKDLDTSDLWQNACDENGWSPYDIPLGNYHVWNHEVRETNSLNATIGEYDPLAVELEEEHPNLDWKSLYLQKSFNSAIADLTYGIQKKFQRSSSISKNSSNTKLSSSSSSTSPTKHKILASSPTKRITNKLSHIIRVEETQEQIDERNMKTVQNFFKYQKICCQSIKSLKITITTFQSIRTCLPILLSEIKDNHHINQVIDGIKKEISDDTIINDVLSVVILPLLCPNIEYLNLSDIIFSEKIMIGLVHYLKYNFNSDNVSHVKHLTISRSEIDNNIGNILLDFLLDFSVSNKNDRNIQHLDLSENALTISILSKFSKLLSCSWSSLISLSLRENELESNEKYVNQKGSDTDDRRHNSTNDMFFFEPQSNPFGSRESSEERDNPLSELFMSLKDNKMIKLLDISHNLLNFDNVPLESFESLEANTSIRYLMVDHNRLVYDDASFSKFSEFMYYLPKNIIHLNLQYTGIDSSHIDSIVRGVVRKPSIIHLNLSDNLLDHESCSSIGSMLSNSSCSIKSIDLSSNHIWDNGARILSRSLSSTPLLNLNLSNNRIGRAALDIVSSCCMRMKKKDANPNETNQDDKQPKLRHINLSLNNVNGTTITQIDKLCETLAKPPYIMLGNY
eukprot:TRINITY_DN8887_c0_g1_i2.p1 TRINITY_DN8887_c0_g1~~TRINITY_DN8887_c0_g1_i2.p1  ORF type:complete len:904 (-),score=138.46 TRINITY_DN8887_c0_g1_i2:26-2737(-)